MTQDGITHMADSSASESCLAGRQSGEQGQLATCHSSTSKVVWNCSPDISRFKESEWKHARPFWYRLRTCTVSHLPYSFEQQVTKPPKIHEVGKRPLMENATSHISKGRIEEI